MRNLTIFLTICAALCGISLAEEFTLEKKLVLTLAPGENNPRNSEGDFIRLKNDDILFIYTQYYGGSSSDHAPAVLAGITSADEGETWSAPVTVVENEGRMNVMSVSLLRLADGRIALYYLRKNAGDDNRAWVRYSSDEAKTWSEPECCIPDVDGYYVLNNARAVQLKSGRILLPVALHNEKGKPFAQNAAIMCYYSDDAGKTWLRSGEAANPGGVVFQEPGVVELSDGRVLMIIRANAGCQFLSWSEDGGKTWSPAERSAFTSPLAPAGVWNIPETDKLVFIWNDHRTERDPFRLAVIDEKLEVLQAFTLDESGQDMKRWFCYPAFFPLGDGEYLVSYCAGPKPKWGLDTTRILKIKLK